jgi:alkanesulfonate monooxygenase SsuD/methylene tetrahydromethanopterin reductase-like flavin-dependent oxidoreductase (luciferase family)
VGRRRRILRRSRRLRRRRRTEHPKLKRALYVPNAGDFADVAILCELAERVEAAGWDGVFLWDHLVLTSELVDPWVALSVMATRTERVLLGTMITPVARRRPQVLALQASTLARVSGGRLVLGVGPGAPQDFERFGERRSTSRLEEGVEVMRALWSGEPVRHHGRHFSVEDVAYRPPAPHIPLWAGGDWPRERPIAALEHAEGVFLVRHREGGDYEPLSAQDVRALKEVVGERDIAVWSRGAPPGLELDELEAAGTTWWLVDGLELGLDGIRRTIG